MKKDGIQTRNRKLSAKVLIQKRKIAQTLKHVFSLYSNANLILPVKSKKKRGSVMDFFSPFGDSKPFGGFGSHMSGTFGKETNTKKILNTMK